MIKGERKLSVLVGYFIVLMLHVIGFIWWNWNEVFLNPLIMVPPKAIPPSWHAIFTILVMEWHGRSNDFHRQSQVADSSRTSCCCIVQCCQHRSGIDLLGQRLWKSLFITDNRAIRLYITFKLTSVVEKVVFSSLTLHQSLNI